MSHWSASATATTTRTTWTHRSRGAGRPSWTNPLPPDLLMGLRTGGHGMISRRRRAAGPVLLAYAVLLIKWLRVGRRVLKRYAF